MKNRILFYSYLISLFLLALLPLNNTSDQTLTNTFVIQIRLDHLLHGIMFLPYLYLVTRAYSKNLSMLILLALLTAICTEGIQLFLTYRSFNINDLLSNVLGVLLGLAGQQIIEFYNKEATNN